MFRQMLAMITVLCVFQGGLAAFKDQTFSLQNRLYVSILESVESYRWEGTEAMAEDLPDAMITHRGSNTITCRNNTIVCRGFDQGIGIGSFIQRNNVFPIRWSDEIRIGMSYSDLHVLLCNYRLRESNAFEGINTFSVETSDDEVASVTCKFTSLKSAKDSFSIVFLIAEGEIYEIVFSFADMPAE